MNFALYIVLIISCMTGNQRGRGARAELACCENERREQKTFAAFVVGNRLGLKPLLQDVHHLRTLEVEAEEPRSSPGLTSPPRFMISTGME